MFEKMTKLINKEGLHSRKASRFIREAIKFKSEIFVIKDDEEFNGKSIMGILSMGGFKDDEIIIRAKGEDEIKAVDTLVELIESGFE